MDTSQRILEVDGRSWRTPLTGQAGRSFGTARMVRRNYRGHYHYEGVGGYEFFRTRSWLPVTVLQRRHGRAWRTWMVDDPLHWNGMREAVACLPGGRILVAGLGLGLMLHHMAAQDRFTRVTVVELDADVIGLTGPTLPEDQRVEVVNANFYDYIESAPKEFDGILWDLAVGTPAETFRDMLIAEIRCGLALPDVPLVRFGMRRHTGGGAS